MPGKIYVCCFEEIEERETALNLKGLHGNPLRVIRFLCSAIENRGEHITKQIQLSEIAKVLEISRDSVRTAIKFLNKNNLISRVDYFPGVDGWTQYKISNYIFNEVGDRNNRNLDLLRHTVLTLTGLQKDLFDHIVKIAKSNDGVNTGLICTRSMAEDMKCSYDTLKVTLARMIDKGILIRHKGKGGRGGFIVLEVPALVKSIYQDEADLKFRKYAGHQQQRQSCHCSA